MELIKHGHACVVLCEGDRRLVIDPGVFTEADALQGASAVLVTHEHPDHFAPEHLQAALEADPDRTLRAITEEVAGFAMPGTGIPNFGAHAKAIAEAGIYDFAAHHDHILQPIVVKHWGLAELEGLTPEAEEARASTLTFIERVGKAGRRMAERRAARADKAASREPVAAGR